jgi:hypothetical protein
MVLSMDASFAATPVSLTPSDLRALMEKLSQGSLTPFQASEQALGGEVLLTRDAELFFGEALKHGGAQVANLIVDHLSVLRVGHTSASTAKYLGNLLLDYSTDPDVSRKILAWYPDFIDVPAILEHLSIQDERDLSFYQELFRRLIREGDSYSAGDRISKLLVAVLKLAPAWIGRLLSALDQVQTEIDLEPFLKMAAEIGTAKEEIYEQLPLIGRVATQRMRLMDWVFRVYPERRIEALGRILEQARFTSMNAEDAFVSLARGLNTKDLPAFTQLLERYRKQEDWPRKVVIELLYNPNIPMEELVDSQRSFSLYRNVINCLSDLLDRTSDGDRSLDIKRLLTRIVDDTNFGTLDVTTYSALLYEVSRRKGQGDLNPLRILLLERIDFKHATIFHSAFFEALRGYFIEPMHAQRILEKIVRYGKYPFHETDFLLQLLECVDQEVFANFTLRYSQALFDTAYTAERFYLALAGTLPERFAPVYMFHRKIFKRSFAKYSDTDKTIYKLCWPYLSFGQRFKAFIFG